MKAGYFISSIAEQDIDESIAYLAKENPKAAHDFIDALYESLQYEH